MSWEEIGKIALAMGGAYVGLMVWVAVSLVIEKTFEESSKRYGDKNDILAAVFLSIAAVGEIIFGLIKVPFPVALTIIVTMKILGVI